MPKLENIQALRGIAVLLVLMVHIGLVEKKYSLHPILPNLVQFGMSGVDLFFVISGFIMMTISMHRKKNIESAFQFLYLRVVRIYPLYWFYSVLILAVTFVHPEWVNSSTQGNSDLFKSFFLFPQNGFPLLQVGWTLIHEMYFYIGFFILLFFVRSNQALFVSAIVWGLFVLLLDGTINFLTPTLKVVFHPLTMEFIGGILMAYAIYKFEMKFSIEIYKGLFLLSLLLVILNYYLFDAYYESAPFQWWRIFLFGIPAIVMVFVVVDFVQRHGAFLQILCSLTI